MSFRIYRDIQEGEFLVAGYDLAMGGEDNSACVFLSKTSNDVPIIYHANEIATTSTNAILPVLKQIYEKTKVKPVIAPERNAGGVFEIDRMLNSPYAPYFTMYQTKSGQAQMDSPQPNKYGYSTDSSTRPKMLEELKNAIDQRLITIYDEFLINEMFSFIVNKTLSGWKAQAEENSHDDLVMALAIAYQLYQTEHKPMSQSTYVPQNDLSKWVI
jgi:hypothetical protein